MLCTLEPSPTVRATFGYGLILNLQAKGSKPLLLRGLRVAGDLGHLHVFAERKCNVARSSAEVAYANLADGLKAWAPVGEAKLAQSWVRSATLRLHTPVPIPAGATRRLYIRAAVTHAPNGAIVTDRLPLVGELLPICLGRGSTAADADLVLQRCSFHQDSNHVLMAEQIELNVDAGGRTTGRFVPAGGILYDVGGALSTDGDGAAAIATAEATLAAKLTSVCSLLPSIHPANNMLVTEWNADASNGDPIRWDRSLPNGIPPPQVPLQLPKHHHARSSRRVFGASTAPSSNFPAKRGSPAQPTSTPSAGGPSPKSATPEEGVTGASEPPAVGAKEGGGMVDPYASGRLSPTHSEKSTLSFTTSATTASAATHTLSMSNAALWEGSDRAELLELCSGYAFPAQSTLWLRWLEYEGGQYAHPQLCRVATLLPALHLARGAQDPFSRVQLLDGPLRRVLTLDGDAASNAPLNGRALQPYQDLLEALLRVATAAKAARPTAIPRLATSPELVAAAEAADAAASAVEAAAVATMTAVVGPFRSSRAGKLASRLRCATPVPPTLDTFTLVRRFGRGAYGEVYAARKEDTMALFALKMMHVKRVAVKRGTQHLAIERRAAERVSGCPFLCALRYAFIHGPWYVLAFPLLPGGTLQVHLEERAIPVGGLPLDEVRWIAAQLTVALQHLHGLKLLHRDVKPSNIMLRRDGYLVLSDFGLSADLSTGTLPTSKTGTRGYWPPECVRRESQGPAADWWSLGTLVWYVWKGRHPFHQRWVVHADAAGLPQPIPEAVYEVEDDARATSAPAAASTGPAADAIHLLEDALNYNTLHLPRQRLHLEGPPPSPARFTVSLSKPTPQSPLGIYASGDADQPPQITGVYAGGIAAKHDQCAKLRGCSLLSVNGHAVRGHEAASRALRAASGEVVLELDNTRRVAEEALLIDFLGGLLTRDVATRLGASTGADIRKHPFLRPIEWSALTARALEAPFRPDPNLVYAKDFVPALSEDGKSSAKKQSAKGSAADAAPLTQAGTAAAAGPAATDTAMPRQSEWMFCCDGAAYAEELSECAHKMTTYALLRHAAGRRRGSTETEAATENDGDDDDERESGGEVEMGAVATPASPPSSPPETSIRVTSLEA